MSAINFINELNEFYEKKIKLDLNSNFEIPYTTMNIGKINGGSAINSVPETCEFLVDFRTINNEVEEKIIEKIEKLKRKYSADVRTVNCISAFFNKSELSNKTSNFITEASFLKTDSIY